MTTEEIINLAKQAGFRAGYFAPAFSAEKSPHVSSIGFDCHIELERFAALVAECAVADLAQCKEDAERYRFIRDCNISMEQYDSVASAVLDLAGAQLDKAIDAAKDVVITTNEQGECVLVSRQDEEGRIIKVIWERDKPVKVQMTG